MGVRAVGMTNEFVTAIGAPTHPVADAVVLFGVHPTQSVKILVVDDERAIANYLAIFLCRHGHRALPLYDQTEALEHAAMLIFDLALVGIVMPGISGLKLADRLRELMPACRIVLVDILDTVEKVRLLRKDFDYLACPFEAEELLTKLQCVEQEIIEQR